ncbi:MAG: PTS system mannose/fructose/sorbose family transporter subunit IID [bacterium]
MKKLGVLTLLRTMYRTLYLHAVWNFERMQNVGFLYAMLPVIKKLYPEKEKRIAALKRHLEFFNTHPYMAAPLIGVISSMEEQMASGADVKPEDITAVKSTMAGPLAALGDSLFWGALRPLAALFGVTIMLWGEGNNKLLGPLFFLVFYNSFHFYVSFVGFWKGYRLQTRVIETIRNIDFQGIIEVSRFLGLIVLAAVVMFFAYQFPPLKSSFFFGLIILLFGALKKGIPHTVLVYVIVFLGFLGSYIGIK